jgi:hypothetical protein
MSAEELQLIAELTAMDAAVRTQESVDPTEGIADARHAYITGPDGRKYAAGSDVGVPVTSGMSPTATAAIVRQVRAATLAPSRGPAQEMQVASTSSHVEANSRTEMGKATNHEGRVDKEEDEPLEFVPVGTQTDGLDRPGEFRGVGAVEESSDTSQRAPNAYDKHAPIGSE